MASHTIPSTISDGVGKDPATTLSALFNTVHGFKFNFWSDSRQLGFKGDLKSKTAVDLKPFQKYPVKIFQQRNSANDYVFTIQIGGNTTFEEVNPGPFVMPMAKVYFGSPGLIPLGDWGKVENIQIRNYPFNNGTVQGK